MRVTAWITVTLSDDASAADRKKTRKAIWFKAGPRRPITAARTHSVTRPFDLARNPAELNCPLVQGCFDRGQG
jgi:hypothetical protein